MAAPTPATTQATGVETQGENSERPTDSEKKCMMYSERNADNQHATGIERVNAAKKACVPAAAQFAP